MKARSIVLIGLVISITSTLTILMFNRPHVRDAVAPAKSQIAADAVTKVILPRQPAGQITNQPNGNPADPGQTPAANPASKESPKDPIAREALTLVGLDPEAEAYWFEAINDMSLPPNERQDLIEDLNEEGLPDPKHPTLDDLPLILSRLELIEAIGPDAADEVNADAFDEAYKDLLNLAELAMGGGEPVK